MFSEPAVMTPRQLRAARAFLNWSRVDLSRYSGVSAETIRNIEYGRCKLAPATIEQLTLCFTDRGIEFIAHHNAQGVMLISEAGLKGQPKTSSRAKRR
jgi:transcriptional regulator with XRE-family HTH domain